MRCKFNYVKKAPSRGSGEELHKSSSGSLRAKSENALDDALNLVQARLSVQSINSLVEPEETPVNLLKSAEKLEDSNKKKVFEKSPKAAQMLDGEKGC